MGLQAGQQLALQEANKPLVNQKAMTAPKRTEARFSTAKNRPCTDRDVPALGRFAENGQQQALWTTADSDDPRTSIQEAFCVEGSTKDPLVGCQGGKKTLARWNSDCEIVCGRTMHRGYSLIAR